MCLENYTRISRNADRNVKNNQYRVSVSVHVSKTRTLYLINANFHYKPWGWYNTRGYLVQEGDSPLYFSTLQLLFGIALLLLSSTVVISLFCSFRRSLCFSAANAVNANSSRHVSVDDKSLSFTFFRISFPMSPAELLHFYNQFCPFPFPFFFRRLFWRVLCNKMTSRNYLSFPFLFSQFIWTKIYLLITSDWILITVPFSVIYAP